jgi:hypothetical protein
MDTREFLTIESSLLLRLRKAWAPMAAALYAELQGLISSGDFDGAREVVLAADLKEVAESNREFVKYSLWAFAVFGAHQAAGRPPVLAGGKFDSTLERLASTFIAEVAATATRQVHASALQLIAQAEEDAAKVVKAEDRYLNEFVSFAKEGMQSMQLIASLHASRLSTWGFTAEADLLGITEYQLSAVLDGRTSQFCKIIHGHTFRVADAHSSITTILSAQNPDDLRTLQPWPKQDAESLTRYGALTSEELTAEGLHIPPYHPRCRTLCIKIGKVPLRKPKVMTPEQAENRASVETFEELGVPITAKQVEYWNNHVGQSPVAVLSKLAGLSPIELLAKPAILSGLRLKIAEDGQVSFASKTKFKDVVASQNAVYDPFNGKLHSNYLEMRTSSPDAALRYLARHNLNLMEVASDLQATGVTVLASGSLGVYTYGQLGYMPTDTAWFSLKQGILDDLVEGGPLYAKVSKALSTAEMWALEAILNSTTAKAFTALAGLNFKVGGVKLGKLLLEGKSSKLEAPVGSSSVVANLENNL